MGGEAGPEARAARAAVGSMPPSATEQPWSYVPFTGPSPALMMGTHPPKASVMGHAKSFFEGNENVLKSGRGRSCMSH
jgi:hypothetical protein